MLPGSGTGSLYDTGTGTLYTKTRSVVDLYSWSIRFTVEIFLLFYRYSLSCTGTQIKFIEIFLDQASFIHSFSFIYFYFFGQSIIEINYAS